MKHSQDILAQINLGSTVITPNKRLAKELIRAYANLYRPPSGPLKKPLCLPYDEFLQYMFQKLEHEQASEHHPLLLNSAQERCLWRIILERAEDSISESLLDNLQDSWSNALNWKSNLLDPEFEKTPQSQRFQRYCKEFIKHLKKREAITQAQLVSYLISKPLALPKTTLLWSCFDEFTPAQQSLQRHLSQQGFTHIFDDLKPKSMEALQFAAEDQEDEFLQMLAWAKTRLNQGDKHIALVVPDLSHQSTTLLKHLKQHFREEEFNLSLGHPLSLRPIISTALEILALAPEENKINQAQLRFLLHSPFIGEADKEFSARAQCLENPLAFKELRLSWSKLSEDLRPKTPSLAAYLAEIKPYPPQDSPLAWSAHFKTRLACFDFPGSIGLDALNRSYLKRFIELLDELAQLTAVTDAMSQDQALQCLNSLCDKTLFQIKKPECALNILGLLEASGCSFDSIWISGLTDECLPQKPRFSAFIPISLQIKHQFPHSSALKELKRAEQSLERFGFACDRLVYSYAKWLDDSPKLPSSLIRGLKLKEPIPLTPQRDQLDLEFYRESYHLAPGDDEELNGGSGLLASQATCPFQAFANYRLKAKPKMDSSEGPDASERGQMMHRVMELLWQSLQNQATLLAIPAQELDLKIDHCIHQSLKRSVELHPESFPPLIQNLEKNRLKQLVYAALAWDKQRPPFVIYALEQSYTIKLSSLNIKLRVDRIDQSLSTESDHLIVIDYKSSIGSKPWREERPEALQLLLYALLDKKITVLLWMELKMGRLGIAGLADPNTPLADISTLKANEDWTEFQSDWYRRLSHLADEIKNGRCDPSPSKANACMNCNFSNLCRI